MGGTSMKGIPSNILREIQQILLECDEISTNARLMAMFNDPKLLPFKFGLPEASNYSERVDLLIDFLSSKKLRTGESVFIVFLEILKSRISEEDDRHERLAKTISALMEPAAHSEMKQSSANLLSESQTSISNSAAEKYHQLINRYRKNLSLIDEQIASFIDPRSVPLDITINRNELVKKINELENEVSFQSTLPFSIVIKSDGEAISNKEIIRRLNTLERIINKQFDDLKRGQTYIYQKVQPLDMDYIKKISEEIHQGRIEQGELQRTVNATRRVIKHIMDDGVKFDDPQISKALTDIYQSVNSTLSFEQQFELTLPVIPFLINYKLGLGSGVDLGAAWDELITRVKKFQLNG